MKEINIKTVYIGKIVKKIEVRKGGDHILQMKVTTIIEDIKGEQIHDQDHEKENQMNESPGEI